MEKKLKCDCGSSLFNADVKVHLVDLSYAANKVLQFLYNECDQKPVCYPEELLKEIGCRKYDKYNCPSLLMLAFHGIEAIPVRMKNELDNHCASCEKCNRFLQSFKAETVSRKVDRIYRHESSLVLLDTQYEHTNALREYSWLTCTGCGQSYKYYSNSGLEEK